MTQRILDKDTYLLLKEADLNRKVTITEESGAEPVASMGSHTRVIRDGDLVTALVGLVQEVQPKFAPRVLAAANALA